MAFFWAWVEGIIRLSSHRAHGTHTHTPRHPPLPLAGFSIGMERGSQQNDRTLAFLRTGRSAAGSAARSRPAPPRPRPAFSSLGEQPRGQRDAIGIATRRKCYYDEPRFDRTEPGERGDAIGNGYSTRAAESGLKGAH